ncbi:MAG: hypothetical protein SOU51_05205 [Collinsella sp.]|nr:hypothetical protein [Collinsella sp.]
MSVVDIAILTIIGVAVVAVVVHTKRKGTCSSCPSSGSCSTGKCPACRDVDSVAKDLGRGVGH